MNALNKKQRRSSFLKFLLLFVLLIGLILTTVFFSYKVPLKQNDEMINSINEVRKEKEFSSNFATQLSGISAMLDSMNIKGQKPETLDIILNDNLKKLSIMVDRDSVYNKSMYRNIVFTLADLGAAKKQLRELTGKDVNLSDLQKQKEELSKQLYEAQQENLRLNQDKLQMQQQKRNN